MIRVFIDGAAGTTGLRLRARLTSRADIELLDIPDELRKEESAVFERYDAADFVFLCLPDDSAKIAAQRALLRGCRVIDCSTAHRVVEGWVYGFPELCASQREAVRVATRVAVPGCYASGFIALARPLTDAGVLNRNDNISFFALSGYTGAGKAGIVQYENKNRDTELDSPRQYALTQSHKHLPEMTIYAGLKKPPIFSPVICDFPCGMTVTLPVFSEKSGVELLDIYSRHYANSRVIKISGWGEPPCGFLGSNSLAGSDAMHIYVTGTKGRYTAIARFDNLGKGASGAAIQCFNLMSGAGETEGLECS